MAMPGFLPQGLSAGNSFLPTEFVSPTVAAENAAISEELAKANLSGPLQGLKRGIAGFSAPFQNAYASVLDTYDPEAAETQYAAAAQAQANAQAIPVPYENWSDAYEKGGVGGVLGLAGGKVMEGAPLIAATLPAGLMGRSIAARNGMSPLVGGVAGETVGFTPVMMGDLAGRMHSDEVIQDTTTPEERLAKAVAYAVPTSAAMSALPAFALNRMAGASSGVKNVFDDGVAAATSSAAKNVAKSVPEAVALGGLPSYGAEELAQSMLTDMSPGRDTTHDDEMSAEAFAMGTLGMGAFGAAGRVADVGWANARGANHAIGKLLEKKRLPDHLRNASDEEVLKWDEQDEASRNEMARTVAESISKEEGKWAEKAKDWLDSGEDWTTFEPVLKAREKYTAASEGVERFMNAAKVAWDKSTGSRKNEEFTHEDNIMMQTMMDHLDPDSALSQDDGRASALYSYLKQSILDDKADLPIHALAESFGGEKQLNRALTTMREQMVREGLVEPDASYGDRLAKTLSSGATKDLGLVSLIQSNIALRHGEIRPHDALVMANRINKGLDDYPNMSDKQRKVFDDRLREVFGKNTDRVLEGLGRDKPEEMHVYEDDVDAEGQPDPSRKTIHDAPDAEQSFVGSAKPRESDSLVDSHGGFWQLNHGDAETRAAIKARFDQKVRSLQSDKSSVVRVLNPLEYAERAGVSKEEVARKLNTTVDKLADHPARMIHVETKKMDGDSIDLSTEDIVRIANGGQDKQGNIHKGTKKDLSERVDLATANKIREALKLSGGEQRKALRELGFPNAVRVEAGKGGIYVKSNLNHGGEGRFTVHMKDGSEHVLEAQSLIKEMRLRNETNPAVKDRPSGSADLLRNFSQAISSIVSNPDVRGITVNNVWGKQQTADKVNKSAKTQSIYGAFGKYFKLQGDADGGSVTIGDAEYKQMRGDKGWDKEARIKELEGEIDQLKADELTYEELADTADEISAAIETAESEGRGTKRLQKKLAEVERRLDELDYNPEHGDREFAEEELNSLLGDEDNRAVTADEIREKMNEGERKGARIFDTDGRPLHPMGSEKRLTQEAVETIVTGLEQTLAERRQQFEASRVDGGPGDKSLKPEIASLSEKIAAYKEKLEAGEYVATKGSSRYQTAVPIPRGAKASDMSRAQHAEIRDMYGDVQKLTGKLMGSADKSVNKILIQLGRAIESARDAQGSDAVANLDTARTMLRDMSDYMLKKIEAAGKAAQTEATLQKLRSDYRDVRELTEKYSQKNEEARGKENITDAQKAEINEYLNKTLGPKVHAEFVKILRDQKGRATSGSGQWFRKNGEAFIQIVNNAKNPMSKAHHEAMHEFFQRLTDDHPEAADVLAKAAVSAPIIRQLELFFHNEPNKAKIMEAIKGSDHERVAYMYQAWAAGKLKVGPKTEGIFQKVQAFFKRAIGMLSNEERAEQIMRQFHEGKMSEPNAVAQVLAKDPLYKKEQFQRMAKATERSIQFFRTAQNTLVDSGNPELEALGRQWSHEVGAKDKDASYFEAKTRKTNQMLDRFSDILRELDPAELPLVLEGLQTKKLSDDPVIRRGQERIKKMLDQMHAYQVEAGVPVAKVEDYFPRAWSPDAITKHMDEFKAQLAKDYKKKYGVEATSDLIDSVAHTLIKNRGADPITETEADMGYTPYAKAVNKRKIDWIKDAEYDKYMDKDIVNILSTYVNHAVHRSEYARRFGNSGERLNDSLLRGMQHEIKDAVGPDAWDAAHQAAIKLAREVATDNDAPYRAPGFEDIRAHLGAEGQKAFDAAAPKLRDAKKAVMAMEGSLGHDINEKWRAVQSGLITYENVRLLPMAIFANLVDPLGVVVRGGTLNDAYNTFKLGIGNMVNGWQGKEMQHHAIKLSKRMGTIDSGGFLNTQGHLYTSLRQGKTATAINNKLFKLNGVDDFGEGVRAGATQAAIGFIERHASMKGEHSKRYIEELYGEGGAPKLDSEGNLDTTDSRNQDAVMRWVDGAMLRPNAALRPAWASDPHYAMFFHLKNFTYAFHKVILERIGLELKNGNYDPAMTAALAYVPATIGAMMLKGAVMNGGEQPDYRKHWSLGDWVSEGAQRAGLLGIPQFAVDAGSWGPMELGGPAVGQAYKAVKTYDAKGFKEGTKSTIKNAMPKTPLGMEAGKDAAKLIDA